MYYANGNLAAFARPESPPEGRKKSAFIIGAGLASLAAACFLLRDGGVKGEHIHIFESSDRPGGECRCGGNNRTGFSIPLDGGISARSECLWDLLRSVPVKDGEDLSVLDEIYRLEQNGARALRQKLLFFRRNRQESLIEPLVDYLQSGGVKLQFHTRITQLIFGHVDGGQTVERLICQREGHTEEIDLLPDDLVFVTCGSRTDGMQIGNDQIAAEIQSDPVFALWKQAAEQINCGHPEHFENEHPGMTATLTIHAGMITERIRELYSIDPFSGENVTGGPHAMRNTPWNISYAIDRQPRFDRQSSGSVVVWLCGKTPEEQGQYIKKDMLSATGREITAEWLYHLGVAEEDIPQAAETVQCIPCVMPLLLARETQPQDRAPIRPENSVNFAFLGRFARTAGNPASLEYSVRTAMEAVYSLLGIDRAVPEPVQEQDRGA